MCLRSIVSVSDDDYDDDGVGAAAPVVTRMNEKGSRKIVTLVDLIFSRHSL